MTGEVRQLPGASPAGAGPARPLRERAPRRGRGGRAFAELFERGDGEPPAAGASAARPPQLPGGPRVEPEAGGNLDVVA